MSYAPKVMKKGDVTVVAESPAQENDLRFGRGYAVIGEAKQDPKGNLTTDVKKGTEVDVPTPAPSSSSTSSSSTSAADTSVREATSDTAAKAAASK
jgi:hypothetical protein